MTGLKLALAVPAFEGVDVKVDAQPANEPALIGPECVLSASANL